MAKKKPLERYVEAGKEFTEASRRRLEGIAHDLTGETASGREHAEDWAEELLERSRKTAEQLGGVVRREIRHQIKQFNRATNQDVVKAVQQFVERTTKAAAPVMDAATRKVTGTKKADKTAAATKSAPTKKTAAAKKTAPAKNPAPAKKAGAPAKSAAKKAPAAKKAAPAKAQVVKKAAREEGAGCEEGRFQEPSRYEESPG